MNKVKILIPVYNDWQSVFRLLENINSEVSKLEGEFSVIIVNDASTENKPEFSVDPSLTIITENSPSRIAHSELIFSINLKTDCQSL